MKINNVLTVLLFFFVSTFAHANHCILSDGINILTTKHRLYICEHRKVVQIYKIAVGRHGVGKMNEGDNKTPLGLYDLGVPRSSNRFYTFIPILYPTKEQQLAGFTGKDVGIHGPFKLYNWMGSLNTWFDWTQGCVAVGQEQHITHIAQWVQKHPNTHVLLT